MADTKDLSMILDAKIPVVAIESPDETQVLSLLLRFAMQRHLSFYEWSATRGLRLAGFGSQPDAELNASDPPELLAHIARTPGPALYALCDFHPYLKDEPLHIRYLKDIAQDYEKLQNTIVLISHELKIPPEIGRMTAGFSLSMPTDDELMSLVRSQAKEWSSQHAGRRVKTDQATLDKLISNLRGVSHADARILIRHAIFSDGAVTESDIPEINRLKFDLLDTEGVLHFEYDTEVFGNVAGLHNLKRWLSLRRRAFIENTADKPRGLLLLGVQGGGKSLAAKSIAGFWGLPLLRLDFGTLYNKFFGETERNLRNSLKQAELMAPCALWMDEIEKGLATGNSDNATSKRVLGTLLTWMAEQKKAVFVVATSNDITALPPELIRKGRLDEVFFVDLPDHETRMEIFRIHLSKRDMNSLDFDLGMLADTADGFTGAEIEQAVVSARYLSSSQDQPTTVDDLVAALNRTYPLSVLRAESIHGLRTWAEGRTVPA
ncbi:MAG: AAA family ATPase [Proteobacteria bacterium]|nr:AAA family ATPase [Pseudomonadota bacterium]